MAKKSSYLDQVIGIIIILIFAGFSYKGVSTLDRIEGYFYDIGQGLVSVEKSGAGNIVLIDIDDNSLKRIGAWPWSRSVLAEMIDKLDRSGAALIGLNIPLSAAEANQGLKQVQAFREKFKAYPFKKPDAFMTDWILKNLSQIEEQLDNDKRISESIGQNGKVVLTALGHVGGKPIGRQKGEASFLIENFLTSRNVSESVMTRVAAKSLFLPLAEIGQKALGVGHENLTFEKSGPLRSHALFINYHGSLLPSFPFRLAIAKLKESPKKVVVEENHIRVGGTTIPTIRGEMLIPFDDEKQFFTRYSFVDVLRAEKDPPGIRGKIVLIGFNHGESTRIATPASPLITENELNSYILNTILAKGFISRPPLMTYIEIALIFLLGLLVSFVFPRAGQLSRLGWLVGLGFILLAVSMILFSMMALWFKTTYILVCLLFIYVAISLKHQLSGEKLSKEAVETNRLLGLSFQSQGLLDLAFDKFRKLPLNGEIKDLVYNLGLEYERKRMINKAVSAYEYVNKGGGYRDLDDRIPKLKESVKSSTPGSHEGIEEPGLFTGDVSQPRTKVGRYEIAGELGKGSMGVVYKALDPKINRQLAIKTIRFSDEFEEDVLDDIKERFFREAEIAGKLSHPSIVTIHDVGDDRDLTYMAMEYLEGQDLEKYISKSNLLPFRKVLDVVRHVADALDFAHKGEVIHRDIKPANIMLLKNGEVKVTDFGIAKAISSSRTRTGVILGTPNYMSPEQIMGQKIDQRSDIFSLGVVFFQLLTGELPFHGDNLSALLYQITQVKHPSPRNYNPKIPKACEQIVDKALAKNPDERFRTAGDFLKVIQLLLKKIDELKEKRAIRK
ncbi:CHASE2 domain-containing serine/threonine-protein kinase [Thermodesulfobacteriota bacterium]